MQANEVREAILEKKLIAIVRGIERGKIIKTVNALLRGGISLVEITLDQSDERKMQEAFESIRCIRNEFAGRLFPGAEPFSARPRLPWLSKPGRSISCPPI